LLSLRQENQMHSQSLDGLGNLLRAASRQQLPQSPVLHAADAELSLCDGFEHFPVILVEKS